MCVTINLDIDEILLLRRHRGLLFMYLRVKCALLGAMWVTSLYLNRCLQEGDVVNVRMMSF